MPVFNSKISSFFLVILLGFAQAQDALLETTNDDSAHVKEEGPDSIRLFRPPPPKKLKSYDIHMTEYMMKANLGRLSHYAQGSYLNPIYTLDELFIQANMFPESIKNKMFGLALLGGTAQEVFRHTRKFLFQQNIRFVYPNLYGLNLTHPVQPLNMRLHFRAMSLYDRYYMLNIKEGLLYLYYRETPIVYQRGINYKIYKRWRLFAQRAEYRTTAYNGFGLSHSTKKVFFYAVYSQNVDQPQYSRAYLYVNIHFDR